MRLFKTYFHTLAFLLLCLGGITVPVFAQTSSNNVDLGIEFTTDLPEAVKINGVFGVSARVYIEVNSSTVPSGETIRATARLLDPDGLPVETWTQSWSGFDFGTDGSLQDNNEYSGLVLFQVPWTQAAKWTPTAQWKVVLQVFAASAESNLDNNVVEQSFLLHLPDLQADIISISAIDPISGQSTSNFVPNTNYSVTGKITNVGLAPPQPNVALPVIASLVRLNPVGEEYSLGTVIDSQEMLVPEVGANAYLPTGAEWDFSIDELFLPPDAQGDVHLRARSRGYFAGGVDVESGSRSVPD